MCDDPKQGERVLPVSMVMRLRPQPPPEKCAEKARANEPKPPRVTPPEPASEVADDDRLEELSLLKKLWRDDHDPPQEPCPP